jgi:hypothetical protein
MAIEILLKVETGGHPDPDHAIGDGGLAVGCLQIHPIMVAEVNRVEQLNARRRGCKPRTFTLEHRMEREWSIVMAGIMLAHWWNTERAKNVVDLCCLWNRPDGKAPPSYRNKVQAVFEQLT